ncbi:MAG: helix-hairpin-helix domain-containing protein, partial [Nitrososphaerales archaeon]
DGLVLEVTNEYIKELMGFTGHHFCWQIAFKKNTEYHNIKVLKITPQTAKSGRITPVVELEPTQVSGVLISRATGHNFGYISDSGIDVGAIVKVCRSRQVIPYISEVVQSAETINIPKKCPSCGSETVLDGDHLYCTNTLDCPAQIEKTIEYFFKTLGNNDGFGPSTIETLVSNGFNTIIKIYDMSISDFINCGFGEKTSTNLFNQLIQSRNIAVDDYRFLAAFSIPNIGVGGCEKLLKIHKLNSIFDLKIDDIIKISGFAKKSAKSLIESLIKIKESFDYLISLGFNITETTGKVIESKMSGKTVVFTGTFTSNKREVLEKEAKDLGMNVGSAVSSKTDYLIIGEKVGATKINAAEKHGVSVITESEYLLLKA